MLEREPITISSILIFAASVAVAIIFGEVQATRFVACIGLVALIKQFPDNKIGIGWQGCKPSFYITGNAAVIINIITFILALAVIISPQDTILKIIGK